MTLQPTVLPLVAVLLAASTALFAAGGGYVLGELGENDVRLSAMGPDDSVGFFAGRPSVAHNPVDNEFLVVWGGTQTGSQFTSGIYGQRLDAATGAEIGTDDFLISSLTWDADDPVVVYNPNDHEYLVVYVTGQSSDDTIGVYGQRLEATGATPLGPTEFRISQTDGEGTVLRWLPDALHNPARNEYFVVWDAFGLFGQRLDADGNELGGDITYSTEFNDQVPALAYNSADDEYLLVWQRYEDLGSPSGLEPLIDLDYEVFGVRLDPATGGELGAGRFQISEMGPGGPGNDNPALSPDAAYNPVDHEYLVTWEGNHQGGFDNEAFGQRLDASTGAQIGANDFQFSDTGGGACCRSIRDLEVAWDSAQLGYLAIWGADDLANEEWESYVQRLDAGGNEVGIDDYRISNVGPEGNDNFYAFEQVLAYNPVDEQFLAVWRGNRFYSSQLFVGEDEIWGQRLGNLVGAVTVRAAAVGGPITVPPTGGSFEARVRLRNRTASEQRIEVWFDVRSADGSFRVGSEALTLILDPSGSHELTRQVTIPAEAPAGLLRATFYVGVEPLVSGQSSFRLRKSN